jgi:hypothetical protein
MAERQVWQIITLITERIATCGAEIDHVYGREAGQADGTTFL